MIRFSSAASRELEADYRRYERQRRGRGRRFLAALDAVLLRLLDGAASFPIRFRYRIVFMISGEDVFVLAVAHGRHRLGYWKRRVGG